MKITDSQFLRKMLLSRPQDLPGIFGRRLMESVSTAPTGIASTRFGDIRYDVDMSLHAMARKYYFHTHEVFLESVFQHFLTPGGTFIDIGANMGYWSAFSASIVGQSGEIHAFEPVPRFFDSVAALARNNPDYTIHAVNKALGASPGVAPMEVVEPTADNFDNFEINIGSSSMLPGFLAEQKQLTRTIDVEVVPFDRYAAEANLDLDRIDLIKIDVEGYEPYCLAGMEGLMTKPGRKVPILCELLTDPDRELDGPTMVRQIEGHGYRCFDAMTMKPIDVANMQFEENVVCV